MKKILLLLSFMSGAIASWAQETSALKEHNMQLVREFNSHNPVYLYNEHNKKWSALIWIFGLKEGSILETDEIKVSFEMRRHVINYSDNIFNSGVIGEKMQLLTEKVKSTSEYRFCIMSRLTNKTNQTIFVDLGTSYIIRNEIAQACYTPSASSTTSSISSGASLNLGAITNAIGINGPIGTIANGIGISNGNATSNTQITFSQRVVSIPPMSTILLEPQSIEQGEYYYKGVRYISEMLLPYASYLVSQGYAKEKKKKFVCKFNKLKRGQQIDFPDLNVNPLSLVYTYSFDETLKDPKMMKIDFRIKAVMGADADLGGGRIVETHKIDYSECPLIFFSFGSIYKQQ